MFYIYIYIYIYVFIVQFMSFRIYNFAVRSFIVFMLIICTGVYLLDIVLRGLGTLMILLAAVWFSSGQGAWELVYSLSLCNISPQEKGLETVICSVVACLFLGKGAWELLQSCLLLQYATNIYTPPPINVYSA